MSFLKITLEYYYFRYDIENTTLLDYFSLNIELKLLLQEKKS